MTQVRLGDTVITTDTDEHGPFVHTGFPDGTSVMARPVNEPWDSTRVHDPLHSFIAHRLGFGHSSVLWHLAHPNEPWDPGFLAAEEDAVLHIQRMLVPA